jgi:hypothetical protein
MKELCIKRKYVLPLWAAVISANGTQNDYTRLKGQNLLRYAISSTGRVGNRSVRCPFFQGLAISAFLLRWISMLLIYVHPTDCMLPWQFEAIESGHHVVYR